MVDCKYVMVLQCRSGSGACPDTVDATTGSACINDVSDISGFVEEGQQCISFTRPFNPSKLVLAYIIFSVCILAS